MLSSEELTLLSESYRSMKQYLKFEGLDRKFSADLGFEIGTTDGNKVRMIFEGAVALDRGDMTMEFAGWLGKQETVTVIAYNGTFKCAIEKPISSIHSDRDLGRYFDFECVVIEQLTSPQSVS